MGEKIAYVRVSTEEQNEARQIEALEKFGIDNGTVKRYRQGYEQTEA